MDYLSYRYDRETKYIHDTEDRVVAFLFYWYNFIIKVISNLKIIWIPSRFYINNIIIGIHDIKKIITQISLLRLLKIVKVEIVPLFL